MISAYTRYSLSACCTLLVLMLAPVSGLGANDSQCCSGCRIKIQGASSVQQGRLCQALEGGLVFLEANGLPMPQPLVLRVVEQLPDRVSHHAIGQYRIHDGVIYLLDYVHVAGNGHAVADAAFGIPMNPELWASYAVHELAHALAEVQFRSPGSHFTASEYIAAVTQLETMTAPLQVQMLENYQGLDAFASEAEISATYFLLDPARFAVKCWLHYRAPGNGRQFIEQLLTSGLPGADMP